MITVREYVTPAGRNPFRQWLDSLSTEVRARVQIRVLRFELGNLGDAKALGGGIWEARLMFGAGYRIYFGRDGAAIILLLTGGDKASQRRDVQRATEFWSDYLGAKRHGKTQ